MNTQILKGNWRIVKGQMKESWGKLTDDEIDQVEGNYDQLLGKIQQKYGYGLEEARDKLNDFLREIKGFKES